MPDNQELPAPKDVAQVDGDRRDFLRNSVYAAYATPLITLLLVDAQSAAASPGTPRCPKKCRDNSDLPGCQNC